MDKIEKKTGVPKTQRITHQSTQLTTRHTLKHYNIQEDDTSDLSLALHGRIETTESTEQPAMDTEEIATHNDAQNTDRKPPTRRTSEARVDIPESADVDTAIEQLKEDMEKTTRQSHEGAVSLTKRMQSKITKRSRPWQNRVTTKSKHHSAPPCLR